VKETAVGNFDQCVGARLSSYGGDIGVIVLALAVKTDALAMVIAMATPTAATAGVVTEAT